MRKDLKPVAWGSMVWGQVVEGGTWLQLSRGRFLPMHTAEGVEILRHLRTDALPEEEPQQKVDEGVGNLGTLKVLKEVRPVVAEDAKDLDGSGALYEVIAERVALRVGPSLGAAAAYAMPRGAKVELFAWDQSRKWRQCREPKHRKCGWVLLDHEELGPLLRPEGQPLCARPLDPICVAATEGRLYDLRRFMSETSPLDLAEAADVSGCGPLMLAAQQGHMECCLCLLQAGADADGALKQASHREMHLPPQTRAILQAAAGEPTAVTSAMEGLSPHAQKTLQELLSSRAGGTVIYTEDRSRRAFEEDVHPAARPERRKEFVPEFDRAPDSPVDRGMAYEVVYASVWIRKEPHPEGGKLSRRVKGERVSVVGFDDTRTWARVVFKQAEGPRHVMVEVEGWMLLAHSALGELLRKVEEDSSGGYMIAPTAG
eukprot:TRINITY_DN59198_c0_g1_i1.p1 TRINITY_DN59198_c0_g1~~TRINITY_DN59198_c0_g1_i1.p1  ORF type:complete len:490 (+),score=92.46 TRINITY_DN59198_c0_g1_i1:186-1472(+)